MEIKAQNAKKATNYRKVHTFILLRITRAEKFVFLPSKAMLLFDNYVS